MFFHLRNRVFGTIAILAATCSAPGVLFSQTADEAYESVTSLLSNQPDASLSNKEKMAFNDQNYTDFLEQALQFREQFPEDERYWNLLVQSGYTSPLFIESYKPGIDEVEGREVWAYIVRDEEKVAAFKQAHIERLETLFAADVKNQRVLGGAYGWYLMELEQKAWNEPSAENRNAYHAMMHRYWSAIPENEYATVAADSYLRLLESQAPEEVEGFKAEMESSLNPLLSNWLTKKAEEAKALTEVANLSFTALDGREVDLGTMRGKVILVDFWATWCSPCMAELPNLKAVYDKYHDKGFEVVGVSLDRGSDEEKLKKLVVQKGMPWPQYFDGKAWKGELAQKYGIKAIPAMILIDPNGAIASTDARGDALEPAVKELLGL